MQCHKIWEINPNFPPQNPEIGQNTKSWM